MNGVMGKTVQENDKGRDNIKRHKGVSKPSDLNKESSDINNNNNNGKSGDSSDEMTNTWERNHLSLLFCFVLFVGGVV